MFPFNKKRLMGAVCAAAIAAAAVGTVTIPTQSADARVFFSFGIPGPYYYGFPGFSIGGNFGPHRYGYPHYGQRFYHHPFVRHAFSYRFHHGFHHVIHHGFHHGGFHHGGFHGFHRR